MVSALTPVSIVATANREYSVGFSDGCGRTVYFLVEVVDGPPPLAKSCRPSPECERAMMEGRIHIRSTCSAVIALDDARAISVGKAIE